MTLATPILAANVSVEDRTRDLLQEAIREVQIIAGLDVTRPVHEQQYKSVTVGVTSPDYGDGKTTMAIALASSLAHDFGTEVTLVDADLHTHSIERQFKLQDRPGLTEVLSGEVSLGNAVYRLESGSVQVLPAGKPKADPARIARSDRLEPMLGELKSRSTHVVLDLPAVLHSMNTPAIAQRCDAVIVVVRHGRTTRAQLDRTLHLLRDANVIGVVVNKHHTSIPGWVQRTLGLRR